METINLDCYCFWWSLEIRRSFDYLDVSKDGRISVAEIVRGTQIHGLNPTSKEASEMIAEIDTSGTVLNAS